jgi:hypothetical protein
VGPKQPPSQWVLRIKQLEHDDDYSSHYSAEVKNKRSYDFLACTGTALP